MPSRPTTPSTAPSPTTAPDAGHPPTLAGSISWLLRNFADGTPGVDAVVGVSSDGLLMAMIGPFDRAGADRFAAIVAGLRSLADGAARVLDRGRLSQVVVEMAGGYLVVAQISDGSTLGVITEPRCDLGLVAYETTLLVERVGPHLSPQVVNELKGSLSV
jgi:predicted regulator of Ras-like GTPase activity (Roadblock/LC7/MglB family)